MRRDPFPALLMGDEPVPVVIWLEVCDDAERDEAGTGGGAFGLAALAFPSARPQTSQ